MIQLGDAIKFAELAWIVLDYGWSGDLKADRQYREFFEDVESLAQSLQHLTTVIEAARQSFASQRLEPPPPTFGWHRQSLLEIVGDFDATLRECDRLITDNKSYSTAPGPMRNLQWNAFVMPSVERLRRRILMHQSKLKHLLIPFEIDLKMRLHTDLTQRIDNMHEDVRNAQIDVRAIRRQMEALQRFLNPDSVLGTDPEPQEVTTSTLVIPSPVEERLEGMLSLHFRRFVDEDGTSALSDLADAFVRHLDNARSLESTGDALHEETEDTGNRYIRLLICQFLMSKMRASEDVLRAPTNSHWPNYVGSLDQELQKACRTFIRVNGPEFVPSNVDSLEIPEIWEEETPEPYVNVTKVPTAIDHILELDLVSDKPSRWRKVNLFRYRDGGDRSFRLDISGGNKGQPATETQPVKFDLESASLFPRYAHHTGKQPLEMMLKREEDLFPLEFLSRPDLYLFQQALTGYKVVDNYMSYEVTARFSTQSKPRKIEELAAVQLWLPSRLEGDPVSDGVGEEHVKQRDGYPPVRTGSSSITSIDQGSSLNMSYGIPRRPVAGKALPRRRDSVPVSNPEFAETRSAGRNNSTTTAGPSRTSLTSPMANLFSFPRRVSTGPGSASRPNENDQEPARVSRTGSLSSNSTSSTGNTQRVNGDRHGSFSALSVNTMATSMSAATAKTVSVSGHGNTASVGTLHCKPGEPMLVFFTQGNGTEAGGIVALPLEQRVAAKFNLCECTTRSDCRMTIIEAVTGSDILPITRLGGVVGAPKWWDILSLAEPMKSRRSSVELSGVKGEGSRAWERVFRVSMEFKSVDDRKSFAGNPCDCPRKMRGQVMACLKKGHRGHLGVVREVHRRQMVDWHEQRYGKQVNMVDKPQWQRPGSDW